MKTTGKITSWNADRGFGFVQGPKGTGEVFLHISAFTRKKPNPEIGELVSYRLSKDPNGRPCGLKVNREQEGKTATSSETPPRMSLVTALLFLGLLLAATLTGWLPWELWVYYGAISGICFFMYWLDKNAAQRKRWRIQESSLHIAGLLGGWPAAALAQEWLRHKTQKTAFRRVFWLTIAIHLGVFAWLFTAKGQDALALWVPFLKAFVLAWIP